LEDAEASDTLDAPRQAMTRDDFVAYIKGFDQRTNRKNKSRTSRSRANISDRPVCKLSAAFRTARTVPCGKFVAAH
jgi:hypothetical protein